MSEPIVEGVGASLRKQRMLRGQSLEAVHQHTRIPKKLLEALENDERDAFPAPVYMRGFLRTYCDYLELDFDPLWAKIAPPEPSAGKPLEPRRANDRIPAFTLPLNEATLLPFLLVAGLVLVAGVTWLIKGDGGASAPPLTPKHAGPRRPADAGQPAVLTLNARQDVVVHLRADDQPRFEGRMPAQSEQRWEARRDFALRVSDTEHLRVTLDGVELSLDNLPPAADGWRRIARP